MKIAEVLLIGVTALSACKKQPTMDPENTNVSPQPEVAAKPVNATDTVTYLALGDSYTIGEAVPEQESYPFQLAAQLKARGIKIGTPKIIARTGWTTQNLKKAVEEAKLTQKFTFVTLLIGVNNQYQNFNTEAYRKDFADLVNIAISLCEGGRSRVFILSIPDWSVTPFAQGRDLDQIAHEIATYNAINDGESSRLHVSYTNITPISIEAKTDDSLTATDGLHPSGKMYTLWVNDLLPKVMTSFK